MRWLLRGSRKRRNKLIADNKQMMTPETARGADPEVWPQSRQEAGTTHHYAFFRSRWRFPSEPRTKKASRFAHQGMGDALRVLGQMTQALEHYSE